MQVGIPESQVYAIKEGLPVAEASKEYEGQLLGISQKVLPRNGEGTIPFSRELLATCGFPWLPVFFAANNLYGGSQEWECLLNDLCNSRQCKVFSEDF